MKSLVFLLLSSWLQPLDHDIHIGVCDMKVKDTHVELVVKTFIDDLQIAVGLTPGEPLPDDYVSAEKLIGEYITSTVQIKLDGAVISLELEDLSSSTGDAVWVTLEGQLNSPLSDKLECAFELLTDIYSDQTNLINVYYNDEKEVYLLNTKKISFTYEPD